MPPARPDHRRFDPYWTAQAAGWLAFALVSILTLLPTVAGLSGNLYLGGALVLGLGFLAFIFRFWQQPSRQRARHTLWASLVYLPLVYLLLLADRIQ